MRLKQNITLDQNVFRFALACPNEFKQKKNTMPDEML